MPDDVALGASFRRGTGHGLLYLGSATARPQRLPPTDGVLRKPGAVHRSILATTSLAGLPPSWST
ncbi:hypothetical protein C9I56_35135 [Paraburkholderia caribensis]|nr:hypothetical protein C9I56_35135 [Paraburkholderia caribensis]